MALSNERPVWRSSMSIPSSAPAARMVAETKRRNSGGPVGLMNPTRISPPQTGGVLPVRAVATRSPASQDQIARLCGFRTGDRDNGWASGGWLMDIFGDSDPLLLANRCIARVSQHARFVSSVSRIGPGRKLIPGLTSASHADGRQDSACQEVGCVLVALPRGMTVRSKRQRGWGGAGAPRVTQT